MPTRRVTIGSKVGLHARPARLLVEAATAAPAPVRIGRTEAEAVPATSILAVMSLGIAGGEEVVLTADGDGAETALADIAALLSKDLDSAA
ncbi:HPr family phosphocarrier protein [Actinokineospora guangxiensis]|uniref:HPr family phosphocarrier protein n=1 Tax=Actinokineospora guangxiensis TaxID=1490288 RepID=A0ABW0ERS6_9PSEU